MLVAKGDFVCVVGVGIPVEYRCILDNNITCEQADRHDHHACPPQIVGLTGGVRGKPSSGG